MTAWKNSIVTAVETGLLVTSCLSLSNPDFLEGQIQSLPELGDREFSCGSIFIFSLMCSFTTVGPWMFSEWCSAVLVNQGLSEGSWGARPGFYLFCFFFPAVVVDNAMKDTPSSPGCSWPNCPVAPASWWPWCSGLKQNPENRKGKQLRRKQLRGCEDIILNFSLIACDSFCFIFYP